MRLLRRIENGVTGALERGVAYLCTRLRPSLAKGSLRWRVEFGLQTAPGEVVPEAGLADIMSAKHYSSLFTSDM